MFCVRKFLLVMFLSSLSILSVTPLLGYDTEEIMIQKKMLAETSSPVAIASQSVSTGLYIAEDEYVLGAGDELSVYIWGIEEKILHVTVSHSGLLLIPTVGSFQTAGRTFLDVQRAIIKEVRKKYRTKKVDILLKKLKDVTVYLYGEVANPGTYTISGGVRLSTLIEQAGGVLAGADLRTVRKVSRNGEEDTIDVLYGYTSLTHTTPYLLSGDKIMVTPRHREIRIYGAVVKGGIFSHQEGDTLQTFIDLAGGFRHGIDSSRIIVTRFEDNRDSLTKFELSVDDYPSFVVQADDRIQINMKPEFRIKRDVKVTGEVFYPGFYSVRDEKTKLVDIIGLAGGLTDKAYLRGSRIIRKDYNDAGKSEYKRLKNSIYSELSPDEKSYLKYRTSGATGAMSIYFDELLSGKNELDDIILRAGDEIYIATRDLSVNVMGAVVKPGLVPFKEDAGISYYIEQAGGYKSDALRRDLKIVKGGTEIWLKPKQVDNIEVGDAIWIPEKQYVDQMKRTRDILTILGGIATIVTASITVMKYMDKE